MRSLRGLGRSLAVLVMATASGCQSSEPMCQPQDAGPLPAFVPPLAPTAACSDTQIQAYYAACIASSLGLQAGIAAEADCDSFKAEPNNATCLQCMVTRASSSAWGAIVSFPNGNLHANIGGCIARMDNDAAPGSCAAAEEAREQCEYLSCAPGCPSALESRAYYDCSESAIGSVCAGAADAAQCRQGSRYAGCRFDDFQAYVIGLGRIFCVGDGGADGGPDAAGGP